MSTIAATNSLFEIDAELDSLLDEIEEQTAQGGEPSGELVARFQQFCSAHGEKVDRIGRFLRRMEAREQFCRSEAARLSDRARAAAGKVERTKNMVLYYLMSRDLKAIEGREFTLRAQKNSQDSVRITDEAALPVAFRKIDARIGGVLWETVLANLPDELGKMLESTCGRVKAGHGHDQSGHPARRTGSRGRAAAGMAPENQVGTGTTPAPVV